MIERKLLLETALSYLPRFSIIPIGSNKRPLIKWKEFQNRKPTEEEVSRWCTLPDITGIAIVTGKISCLTVLDVEAGVDIATLDIPDTPTVKTGGGGFHFYFAHSSYDFNNFARFRDKMDIRGEGGYVIAPPSLHLSGEPYRWEISLESVQLAEMPSWLVSELNQKMHSFALDWQPLREGVSQGQRNEAATKYVGHLLATTSPDQWEEVVWTKLTEWNLKCRPPLLEKELRSVFDSIAGRELRKREAEKIDVSKFTPLTSRELTEILGLTIKQDECNKLVTFLSLLSAYTDSAQINISYNAPSSTGKSYIPLEIATLFPKEDVLEIGYCSPTAFFHDVGVPDLEHKGRIIVDLSRKILIFLDQPHTHLLERLRPLLSHDKREISVKITDKTQKQGLKTKNVILRGFPAVIFCTAGLRIDEQEATRFLLLSPEVSQEKIRNGILEKIKKEADAEEYRKWLAADPRRQLLKERIRAIWQEHIADIKVGYPNAVRDQFFEKAKSLKPRHQRDIGRLMSLIKLFALLNLWWRPREGPTIVANETDIGEAFEIWEKISTSQELSIPPYIYHLYQEVIVPAWQQKNSGVAEKTGLLRQEIIQKHYEVYGRMLPTDQLRQQILPMLETAGLITQEADARDKRKMLVYPTLPHTISEAGRNSVDESRVNPRSATASSLDDLFNL